jgi:GABA(A) receptor-associated protein
MNVSTFICIIRTKINKTLINSQKAIFTFVKKNENNYILIPMNENMGNIYDNYKQDDGFLYIKFGIENTFG